MHQNQIRPTTLLTDFLTLNVIKIRGVVSEMKYVGQMEPQRFILCTWC